jgi:hypothetical protein
MKEFEMGRTCSTDGVKRDAYRISVRNPKVKDPLRIRRCVWKTAIKMYRRGIG